MYGWAANGNISLAETYFAMKAYQKSREAWDQAVRLLELGRTQPSTIRGAKLAMVRCGVLLGEMNVDLEWLRLVPEKNRFKLMEGSNNRALGDILLNLGGSHMAESEQWMQKAIDADAENGRRFELALDHALYGEFFKRQGNRDRAKEALGKAIGIMTECGADGWVETYEKELATLS